MSVSQPSLTVQAVVAAKSRPWLELLLGLSTGVLGGATQSKILSAPMSHSILLGGIFGLAFSLFFLGRLTGIQSAYITAVMISSRSDHASASAKFPNVRFRECKSVVVCLLLLMRVSAFSSDAASVTTSKGNTSATSEYAERDGAAEAKQDIATGNRKLKTFGLAAPWIYEYAELLKERLGVQLERIAGCVVNRDLLTYARAYNSVIQEEAEKKYGRDILGQLGQEAKQLYLTRSSQTRE